MLLEKEDLHKAVERAVSETTENIAFSVIYRCKEDKFQYNDEDLIWSSIVMKRPIAGEVTICMPSAMVQEIVGLVYGEAGDSGNEDTESADSDSPEGSDQILKDTLGEMVNTVVGLMLSYLVPQDQEFAVGLPETDWGRPDVDEADLTYYSFNDHCFMVAVDS